LTFQWLDALNYFSLGSGEFVVVNKHLLHDLTEMGVWSPVLKNNIIYQDGSVQKITEIPDDLKAIYKYVKYDHPMP
jgi:ribonucleoside-diphosphate reductase subunit M1